MCLLPRRQRQLEIHAASCSNVHLRVCHVDEIVYCPDAWRRPPIPSQFAFNSDSPPTFVFCYLEGGMLSACNAGLSSYIWECCYRDGLQKQKIKRLC